MSQTILGVTLFLAAFVGLQWHDNYTEQLIADREFANRQQRIEAIRAMDCGVSPVYLAQGPEDK